MIMNKKIKEAFEQVRADEKLKEQTRAFLAQKRKNAAGSKRRRLCFCAAACACLLLLLIGAPLLYFTPTSVISIDINPSLELGVNRFDRIVSVNGLNADGQLLANAVNLKFKDYRNGLEQLLENQSVTALLSGDEVLAITVTGRDETQSARIFSELEVYTAGHKNTYCYHSTPEEVSGAHESGLSCGKYRAFLELLALDPDITTEAVQDMTMGQIMKLIESLSCGHSGEASTDHDAEELHHDSGNHGENSGHRQKHGGDR